MMMYKKRGGSTAANQKVGCHYCTISRMVISYLVMSLLSVTDSVSVEEGPSSARSILMYLPMSCGSHQNVFRSFAEALMERGHKVTMVVPANEVLRPFAETEKMLSYNGTIREIRIQFDFNVESIIFQNSQDLQKSGGIFRKLQVIFKTLKLIAGTIRTCHMAALTHPEIREILTGDLNAFDLVIVPALMNEIGYFMAYKLKVPLILLMVSNVSPGLTSAMGYFDNPAVVQLVSNSNSQNEIPDFRTRVTHFIIYNTFSLIKKFMFTDTQTEILHDLDIINKDMAIDLLQLERNASFGMYFTHYLFDAVRPTLLNTADIGFIHCRPPRSLQAGLADWFDNSNTKVIYISLGSLLSFESIDESLRKAVTGIFVDTKYRFVLKSPKFHADQKNVKTCGWCPQQDILGHPKTVLFVSQGGLMSVQEAIYHGVPVLFLPYLSMDGLPNARRAERQGYGLALNISLHLSTDEITDHILHAIDAMLHTNATYTIKAKQLGNLVRDDISTPAEKAVFWSEYVMRYAGAGHIKYPARNMSFFHFFYVDIFLFFTVLSFLFLFILRCVVRIIFTIARNITLKTATGIRMIKGHFKQD